MLHVEEIERRRISRELHDEAGQSLLCIRLQMELLEQNSPRKREWRRSCGILAILRSEPFSKCGG